MLTAGNRNEKIIGLAISNIRSAKIGFFIIGKANTGKSTLIALLRQIVGEENASALSLSDLAKDFRLEQAADKKLNTISELAQSNLKHLDILKTVIGEGVWDYLDNGLPPNIRYEEISPDDESDDGFERFVDTYCVVEAGAWLASKDLKSIYNEFCDKEGIAEIYRASANRMAIILKAIPGVSKLIRPLFTLG